MVEAMSQSSGNQEMGLCSASRPGLSLPGSGKAEKWVLWGYRGRTSLQPHGQF